MTIYGYTFQQTTNEALFTFKASAGLFAALVTNAYNQLFSLDEHRRFRRLYQSLRLHQSTATLTDTTTGNFTQTSSTY